MSSSPSLALASSPPSSPPSSPFSSLPTELIQHVLNLTVPHVYHSTTYPSRQATLRSLCLVSKLFRQIAQPLLYSVVHFAEIGRFERWKATPEEVKLAHTPRELLCYGSWFDSALAQQFFQHQMRLTTLVLGYLKRVLDLASLSHLKELKILRLTDVEVSCTDSVVWLNLQELYLDAVTMHGDLTSTFGDSTFPSLLAFASYGAGTLELIEKIVDITSRRLEAVSIDLAMASNLSDQILDRIKHRTLFDCLLDDIDSYPGLAYLRYIARRPWRPQIERVARDILETAKDSLPSILYLSPSLDPEQYRDDRDDEEEEMARLGLVEACQEKGIEVVFEELPITWGIDSGISGDFWRRMKQKNRSESST